jgi:hydrogenase nickel incorporation protein HypB
MCVTCGCGDPAGVRVRLVGDSDRRHEHPHPHEPVPPHDHVPPHEPGHRHPDGRTISLEQAVLAKNDELASGNRRRLAAQRIRSVNLMSSPGAGKTTLLERTIRELGARLPISVIEGDQETTLDADRIRATGCRVVQINTGAGCHLDADMLARGLDRLRPEPGSLLFVENVGNLVCPALFDLGEQARVVVISVTEGADKPLKYPHMFATADALVVNKTDLLPYVDFDIEQCASHARSINPELVVMAVSATRGDGLATWYRWLLPADSPHAPDLDLRKPPLTT